MTYWILTVYGSPIKFINVQRLTEEEQAPDEYIGQMEQFNTLINGKLDANGVNINIASVPH